MATAGVDLIDPDLVEADIGFPDCIVTSPCKRQAKRLFKRFDSLREWSDRDDREWMDEVGEAASLFLHHGVPPDDELMLEAALAK